MTTGVEYVHKLAALRHSTLKRGNWTYGKLDEVGKDCLWVHNSSESVSSTKVILALELRWLLPLHSDSESDDGDASGAGGEDDESDDGTDVDGGGFLAKIRFFQTKKTPKLC